MVRTTIVVAGACAAGLWPPSQAAPSAETLLTIPQHDRHRARASAPSASISADARLIAFTSYGKLTPDDEDDGSDVYLLDRTTGSVSLLTLASTGIGARTDCVNPHVSGNGRYVVFETGVQDERGVTDIVRLDLATREVRTVSRNASLGPANARSTNPAISEDGQVVAFESSATNLVERVDVNGMLPDVYLWEAAGGTIRLVSVNELGLQLGGGSVSPTISGDGRYVAFGSTSAAATASSAGQRQVQPAQIYVRDVRHNTTTQIRAPSGAPNNWSAGAAISRDGRFVAFTSTATNLVSGDRNRVADVFLYDVAARTIALVSRSTGGGAANGASGAPSISADGRFVAFQSDASDLVCGGRCGGAPEDINLLPDVFLFDRTAGTVTWVSKGHNGGWMEESLAPAVSASGAVVAFTSRHPMDARDQSHDFDLFVRIAEP